MALSWITVLVLAAAPAGTVGGKSTSEVFESHADLTPQGKIDALVFDRLKRLGIEPANLCSDSVFVRRVYLDVIGTLPTAQEAWQFIQDRDLHKRAALVDRLLERKEFAAYWAMKWSDLLRIKAEFPINLWPRAVQAYYRWIRTAIKEDMPYDRFVRELLTSSGSNVHVPQVNYYRALQSREPPAIARTVALTFMGARAEKWPLERLSAMAVFFSQIGYKNTGEWKEEIVFNDALKAAGVAGRGRETGRFSGWDVGHVVFRPGPARGVRRLVDHGRRTPGSPAASAIASGTGCWGGASWRSRTTFARTIRPAIPNYWLTWERN